MRKASAKARTLSIGLAEEALEAEHAESPADRGWLAVEMARHVRRGPLGARRLVKQEQDFKLLDRINALGQELDDIVGDAALGHTAQESGCARMTPETTTCTGNPPSSVGRLRRMAGESCEIST